MFGRLLVLAVALAVLAGFTPRAATLEGRILNRASDRPLPGATVRLMNAGDRQFTDQEGRFSFEGGDLAEGDTLRVTHPDFMPVQIPLGAPEEPGLNLEISLIPRPLRAEDGERGSRDFRR